MEIVGFANGGKVGMDDVSTMVLVGARCLVPSHEGSREYDGVGLLRTAQVAYNPEKQ